MELDTRKLRILQAIIDEYMLSASPVGSRAISKLDGLNLSSATIRNEMADLEDMGYLEQPHTSAGRIPSDKAYRIYVNRIMNRAQLSADEMNAISRYYTGKVDEIEQVVRQTAAALSNTTRYTAMVLPPEMSTNRLKHIQLVPLTGGRALVVIVTNTGFASDAVIRIPEDMYADELERLSHMMTEKLRNRRMDSIHEQILRDMSGELAERRAFLNGMMDAIRAKMEPSAKSVELAGTTNMLYYPEYSDLDKAKSFLTAVEGRDTLYNLLKQATAMEFNITIGTENEHPELKDCSIVTATYHVGDGPLGSLGIIGPTRMNYGKVVSILEFMRKSLGDILSNYLEEE